MNVIRVKRFPLSCNKSPSLFSSLIFNRFFPTNWNQTQFRGVNSIQTTWNNQKNFIVKNTLNQNNNQNNYNKNYNTPQDTNLSDKRVMVSFTKELQNAIKRKDSRTALEIAKKLLNAKDIIDVRAFYIIFSCYCKFGNINETSYVLSLIKQRDIKIDNFVVNSYLSCLSKAYRTQELISFFYEELSLCNATSCYIVLDHYTKKQLYAESKSFYEEFKDKMELDEKEYLKLLFINFINQDIYNIKQFIFDLIEYCLQNQKFNEISINYAIRICGEYHNYSMVFRILEYMEENNLKADHELVKRMEHLFKPTVPVYYWRTIYQRISDNSNIDNNNNNDASEINLNNNENFTPSTDDPIESKLLNNQ